MPFKTLSTPKTLAALSAEVVSIAQHEPGGLVAVLTTDPVSMSLHQLSGAGGARTTNISLGTANEVALINRDVAVVRSGDDVWAIRDVQHTAKMDQVGRDIKSLHACPKGETALAIGWDGQGAALAMRQYDVGGRQFTLRGDVRACELGATETYVVVDGAGGGQFRVHPGTTPESGANARVDVPADARSYDRIKGGRDMCALYKRGGDRVCVLSRGSRSEVAAKMVVLDTAAVDVAVIATSLFTIGLDGTVRLFSGPALQQAGDEPMAPTFTMDTPASGEPTVMTSTTKGPSRLWIGTKAGDVIRLEANKAGLDL